MTIYAEYLYIENVSISYMILYMTGRICALPTKKRWIFLGASLAGALAFTLLIPDMNVLATVLTKIVGSIIIILVTFREKGLIRNLKIIMVFYSITALLGGICLGLLFFGGMNGAIGGSGFYIESQSYLFIIAGVIIGGTCLWYAFKHLKIGAMRTMTNIKVKLYVAGNIIEVDGIVDTGNFLKDPISGEAVAVIDKTAVAGMEIPENRVRAIPYKSLGNEAGMMEGLRTDMITMAMSNDSNEVIVREKAVIALYEGDIFVGKEYKAILHPELLMKI